MFIRTDQSMQVSIVRMIGYYYTRNSLIFYSLGEICMWTNGCSLSLFISDTFIITILYYSLQYFYNVLHNRTTIVIIIPCSNYIVSKVHKNCSLTPLSSNWCEWLWKIPKNPEQKKNILRATANIWAKKWNDIYLGLIRVQFWYLRTEE